MLQLLILEKAGSSILYNMVSGIYSFIARVYDIMLKLSGNGKDALSIEFFNLGNIQTVMYTIAGVFMLFRVTVSAVNMIINPDMVSDRNAGAGKIVTRIVTSLAMLILFVPNGWIFDPDSGVLSRLEAALLEDDGLIQKVTQSVTSVPNATETSTSDASSSTTETDATSEDDENATATNTNTGSAKKLNCYYVNIYTNTGYKKDSTQKAKTIDAVYHITFYDDPTAGERTILNTTKYSYTVDTDNGYSALSNLSLTDKDTFSSFPKSCPHRIGTIVGNLYKNYNMKSTNDKSHWYDTKDGIVGYWQTYKSLKKSLSAHSKDIYAEDPISKRATGQDSNNYLAGLKNESVNFSQMTMGTFLSCSDEEEDCEGLKKAALVSTTVDDQIVERMAKGTVHLDFFPAIIVGIGVLVWLLVLCVEVIIRRFKLMLLLMIAPIPIISYSDPNDKMFPQWSKMYASTYLDLFLKLIAIGFATALLDTLWVNHPSSLIETLFYIIAVLLFAKMIPTIISKIFGIDSSHLGGSFKDILGMGKSALGLGAGAAIGGVVGAATGTGILGRASGLAKGTLLGAGSGSKGNLTGGAKSIAATNALKKQGLNWFDRMRYQGLGALGIDPNISERQALAQIDQARTQIETLQGHIDGMDKMIAKTPEVAAFSRKITNGVIQDPTGNKEKAFKEAFARVYEDSSRNTLKFSDITSTKSWGKLSETEQNAFKSEFIDTYGRHDENGNIVVPDISISEGFRAGFMTAKSAAVNSINLLREDKETYALLGNEEISGKGEDGKLSKTAQVLLKNPYNMDTSYDTFMNDVRGATFGPQGELNNLKAQESQKLNFAEKKSKAIK